MNTHKNASLTPKGRAHLVSQIAVLGLAATAQAAGISCRTARKWQRRFFAEGLFPARAGMNRMRRTASCGCRFILCICSGQIVCLSGHALPRATHRSSPLAQCRAVVFAVVCRCNPRSSFACAFTVMR
ncbi:hypothetical protein CK623_11080 [Vandammella animalimorsus]|uniref:DNA-binding domain-containing protein n=1 Tax=Vandammella animalimorsus TaxID=2029117 RepID=A0A2A2ANB8_9BURK|nr:hypothetical protein CK623_11080 [Vandammella animalimorsus]